MMDDENKEFDDDDDFDPEVDDLRRVATYQRYVLFAILANMACNFGVMSTGDVPLVQGVLLLVSLVVVVTTLIVVFLLSKEVFNVPLAVVFSVLMIVPCISLLVLLIVNQKATGYLQSRGVRVGLFGANPDQI
ncbi:MAG: hypothetical protein KDA88_01760 [Planctomycetaceae bacterium]|nr:hypothetical protein [Planctomycetaceae bacterium]